MTKELLPSLNGTLSIVKVNETWCNKKILNKDSFLEIQITLHCIKRKNKKGDVYGSVHKSLKFNVKDDIDVFNESVALYIEIQNKETRNIIMTPYRLLNFPDSCSDKTYENFLFIFFFYFAFFYLYDTEIPK